MASSPKEPSAPKEKPADERELIRELAMLLDETNLTEIEIERAGLRLRVARNISIAAAAPVSYQPAPVAAAPRPHPSQPRPRPISQNIPARSLADGRHGLSRIRTRRQAVHRRRQQGEGRRYAHHHRSDEDDEPDPATRAGTVTQILVEDGQPVEFGEPLVIIE
jgi:acetyl-CoA carboxylase biotin carboxyl carrier protein